MSFNPVKEFNIQESDNPAIYQALQGIQSENDLITFLKGNREMLGLFLAKIPQKAMQSKLPLLEKAFKLVKNEDHKKWSPEVAQRVKAAQKDIKKNRVDLDLKTKISDFVSAYAQRKDFSAKGLENELKDLILQIAIKNHPTFTLGETLEKSLLATKEKAKTAHIRPPNVEKKDLMAPILEQIPKMALAIVVQIRKENDEPEELLAEDVLSEMESELENLTKLLQQELKADPSVQAYVDAMLTNEFKVLNETLEQLSKSNLEESPGKAVEIEDKLKAILNLFKTFGINPEDSKLSPQIEGLKQNIRDVIEKFYLPSVNKLFLDESFRATKENAKEFRQLESLLQFVGLKLPKNWEMQSEIRRYAPNTFDLIQQITLPKIGSIAPSDLYKKSHRAAVSAIRFLQKFNQKEDGMLKDFTAALNEVNDKLRLYKKQMQDSDSVDLVFSSAIMQVRSLIADAVKTLEHRLELFQINLDNPSERRLKNELDAALKKTGELVGTEIALKIAMETTHDMLIAFLFEALPQDRPNAIPDARKWIAAHEKDYDLAAFALWIEATKPQGSDIENLYSRFIREMR